ncbi:hypothetical protein [Paeniglutamicibacter sp. NPDC091659]|uniref:hypothetical protein n=1 Tax=Paeniglutamicibacter sp. NPDC091659 TaxID=3364389 RepID=UPI0038267451
MSIVDRVPVVLRSRRQQRLKHVIASEFLKARTLRSQWLLWSSAVAGGLVGTVAALLFARILTSLGEGIPAGEVDMLIVRAPISGAATVALFLGFAAIHLSANERSTGRERLTDLTVPATGKTFVARLTVTALGAATVSMITFVSACILVLVASELSGHSVEVGLLDQVLAVGATTLAMTLVAVFAAGIGLCVRHGVVAAGVFVSIMVVLPAILGTIGATSRNDLYAWVASQMPAGRVGAVLEATVAGDLLGTVSACCMLIVWATFSVVLAYWCWHAESGHQAQREPAAGDRK